MIKPWDDPRIIRGMTVQLRHRRELLAAGHQPLGWKLAFGSPAAMERLRIDAPLVGFLTDRALVASGATLALGGWKKPAAEPEHAVYLGKDLSAGCDRQNTVEAIAALGPAIEVADVDHPSDDVEGTLLRNIYQRHVILGRKDATRAGGVIAGLTARVVRNGSEIAKTAELQALTGELIDIVRHVADLLGAFGETLQAGQIIIAGSIIPPLWVQPGEEITFQLEPIDTISVRFASNSST
jgi:2-keto-4-pentenoate hydratase